MRSTPRSVTPSRTTLVGSITPAWTRFSYCSVCAVEALFILQILRSLHDNRALVPGVGCDPAHRLLDRSGDNVDADLFIAFELQLLQRSYFCFSSRRRQRWLTLHPRA